MKRDFDPNRRELMDLPAADREELRQDLKNLARINRLFGGRAAVLRMFRKLAGARKRLILVDLATGYGDHPRALAAWCRAQGRALTVVAVDKQRTTLELAREATAPGGRIFYVQADARRLPLKDAGADMALCTLALHHFSEEDAAQILREERRVATAAACIDLVRGGIAYAAVWLLTAVWMREPMTRHDARLSVRRAFAPSEFKGLARQAGWGSGLHQRLPWFRQTVLFQGGEKADA